MGNNILNQLTNSKVEIKPLLWKGEIIPDYEITNNGILFYKGNKKSSWKMNGRNYTSIYRNNHKWQYRLDYMVAYSFLGTHDDAIRLIHINNDIADDNLNNLMWYRKVDVLNDYKNLAIIESDGSIKEEWKPCITEYNP